MTGDGRLRDDRIIATDSGANGPRPRQTIEEDPVHEHRTNDLPRTRLLLAPPIQRTPMPAIPRLTAAQLGRPAAAAPVAALHGVRPAADERTARIRMTTAA